jgi:hypothetical protein
MNVAQTSIFAVIGACIGGAIVGIWPEDSGVVRHAFQDAEFVWVLSDRVSEVDVIEGVEHGRTDRHLFVGHNESGSILLEQLQEVESMVAWTIAEDPRAPERELHVLFDTDPTSIASVLASVAYEPVPIGLRIGFPIEEEFVIITAKGKRYHRWPCQYLRQEQSFYESIPLSEAIDRGLTACIRFER